VAEDAGFVRLAGAAYPDDVVAFKGVLADAAGEGLAEGVEGGFGEGEGCVGWGWGWWGEDYGG